MRSRPRWLFVLLFFAAACNQSQIDPEADVTISGVVRHAGGSVAADAPVALMKEPDAGDVFIGVATVGLSCLEEEFSECGETRRATSDGDGAFAYDLKGSDVQGRFEGASIMELATVLPRTADSLAGAAVSTRFQVQSEQVSVGLHAWEPTLAVVGQQGDVVVRWDDPSPDAFPPEADLSTMRRWVVFNRGTEEVWRTEAEEAGARLDARVLEDTRGGVAAFATIGDIITTAEQGTDIEVLLRSPKAAYASPAGAPPSRGRACEIGGDVHSSCGLTDADLGEELGVVDCAPRDEGCDRGEHRAVTIDLGEAIEVSLVVVRGCAGTCVVDVSADGSSYRQFAHDPEPFPRDIAFEAEAERARYVRVSSEEGLHALREVSVWDDRTIRAEGSLVVAPEEVGAEAAPGAEGGASPMRWILVVAVVLVVAAVVLVAILRRRRA